MIIERISQYFSIIQSLVTLWLPKGYSVASANFESQNVAIRLSKVLQTLQFKEQVRLLFLFTLTQASACHEEGNIITSPFIKYIKERSRRAILKEFVTTQILKRNKGVCVLESIAKEKCNKKDISIEAVVLKKMRELKGLDRKEAGVIFNLSPKTFEKLENGRGKIDEQRLVGFANGYGYSLDDLMRIKSGQFDSDITLKNKLKKENDPKRRDRRFCTPIITKECKALRQLRELKGWSQYKLSSECGFSKNRIGFYECGRRNLDNELIETIISKMGFTMNDFEMQLSTDEMPYEIINECNKMMKTLETKTLKAVRAFLIGFVN